MHSNKRIQVFWALCEGDVTCSAGVRSRGPLEGDDVEKTVRPSGGRGAMSAGMSRQESKGGKERMQVLAQLKG